MWAGYVTVQGVACANALRHDRSWFLRVNWWELDRDGDGLR